jgi:uncharacterized membrane protein YhaH (DUF805 family)
MSFSQAVNTCFFNYAGFAGRASRPELWYFILFLILLQFVAAVVDYAIGIRVFEYVVSLATFLPAVAVEVRRLHDVGRSGWWLFLSLIPLVGVIILLLWFCRRGDAGPNNYGPAPV